MCVRAKRQKAKVRSLITTPPEVASTKQSSKSIFFKYGQSVRSALCMIDHNRRHNDLDMEEGEFLFRSLGCFMKLHEFTLGCMFSLIAKHARDCATQVLKAAFRLLVSPPAYLEKLLRKEMQHSALQEALKKYGFNVTVLTYIRVWGSEAHCTQAT